MAPENEYTYTLSVKMNDGEYKELGSLFNITTGLDLMGEYCLVIDPGLVYPLFDEWINTYGV